MPEIETPTIDFSSIPPEDFIMTPEEILADAQALAENIVKGLPKNLSPAQERILVKNSQDIYGTTADLLNTMLLAKKGVMH